MKNYIKPELNIKEIVALEYINNQTGYTEWADENDIEGVTTYNASSLF